MIPADPNSRTSATRSFSPRDGGLNQFGQLERQSNGGAIRALAILTIIALAWVAITVMLFTLLSSRAPGAIWVVVSLAGIAAFVLSVVAEDNRPVARGETTHSQRSVDSSGWKLARGSNDDAALGGGGIVRRLRRKTGELLGYATARARTRRPEPRPPVS